MSVFIFALTYWCWDTNHQKTTCYTAL